MRACGLPDGARSGEMHTDQFAPMTATNKVRFTFTIVGLPTTGPGSGKANFIVTLLSSKYAFFTRYFSANMVRVLPFAFSEAFSLLSWKSMMSVRRLSKKAMACRSCDQRAHQA